MYHNRRGTPANTTYNMKERSDAGCNYLCLHEHWYDDWVGVAWTPDEYLTFESMGARPPRGRTNLVSSAIRSHVEVQANFSPTWPFCEAELCVNRPFYGPSNTLAGEVTNWTLPNDGLRMQYGAGGQLAIERFTRRYWSMPRAGSIRKCFVHPDYRLGTPVKLHGFVLSSCPERLRAPSGCPAGRQPSLRRPCLELCGNFGAEVCPQCLTPPAPGCGSSSPLDHMKTKGGDVMESFELAHFRIAPVENTHLGFREVRWLSNLSSVIRSTLSGINRQTRGCGHCDLDGGRYASNSSMGEVLGSAYLAEVEHLCDLVSYRLPAAAMASARQEALNHAVSLGFLRQRDPAFLRSHRGGSATPVSLEGMRQALQVLEHRLAQALWTHGI